MKQQVKNSEPISYENILRDELINKILVASVVMVFIAYVCTLLRAFDIGFCYRDTLQAILVFLIVVLTFLRKKMATYQKTLWLLTFYFIGGFSGFYTLGMLGGTIFILPTAVVVMAIFFRKQTTLLYILLSILLCYLIAIGYCTGSISLQPCANILLKNYSHWTVYILSLAILFIVTYVTIYAYRKMMKKLLDKIKSQRDELADTNKQLQQALQDVKVLSGLLPICSNCKKIRADNETWKQLEVYIQQHSQAKFTHSICQQCAKQLYPDFIDEE